MLKPRPLGDERIRLLQQSNYSDAHRIEKMRLD
jgi:hypothetical protein